MSPTGSSGRPPKLSRPSDSGREQRLGKRARSLERLIREFQWDVAAISAHLEDIRRVWAKALGVSGPQWMILMAIGDLDPGTGVSVGDVSIKIKVRSTFVTMETKMLEKAGLVSRVSSPQERRVVLMSLTEKARKGIAFLSARRIKMDETIYGDLKSGKLEDTMEMLSIVRRRIEKASLQLAIDQDAE